MLTDSRDVASEVFCSVLEQVAFLFAEVAQVQDLAGLDRPFVEASMSFDGQLRGRLTMALPAAACPQIAANMLGLEAQDEAAAAWALNSLKELLNVTCGHILTSLAGDRPVFDLSIPQVSEVDAEAVRALAAEGGAVGFLVEDYPVLLRLELQEG